MVTGYTGAYDGAAHGATGTATGVLSESAGRPRPRARASPTSRAAPRTGRSPTAPATTTTPAARRPSSSPRPTRPSSVNGYTGVYDGAAHGATGTATGVDGEDAQRGLDLGASFTNVPGGTANWTFTDVTGNYNDASGTAAIVITKADATITVNGYTGVYDGAAHGATGSATGVAAKTLARPRPRGELHQRARRHRQLDVHRRHRQLQRRQRHGGHRHHQGRRDVTVTGYTGVYDGAAHGATGSATGVEGEDARRGLDLGASFTNVPGGTANWTFTDAHRQLQRRQRHGRHRHHQGRRDLTSTATPASTTARRTARPAPATGVQGEALARPRPGRQLHQRARRHRQLDVHRRPATTTTPAAPSAIVINKADATITVTGYTGVYDGAHTAPPAPRPGVNGETSGRPDLGASFTDVPGGTATWTFTDPNGNYNSAPAARSRSRSPRPTLSATSTAIT